MINKLRSFWQRILNAGIISDAEFDAVMRIRILNGVSVFIAFFAIVNAIWAYFNNIPELIIYNSITIPLMCLFIYCNLIQRTQLAKIIFFVSISIFLIIIELTIPVGVYFYLFPLFIIAAFIIDNRPLFYSYLTVLTIVFVIIEFYGPFDFIDKSQTLEESGNILKNIIVAFILSLMAIDLFRRQYEESRKEVVLKNNLLQEAIIKSNQSAEYTMLLLKEMNHRVKNNLQLISSLLNIHAAQLEDKAAKDAVLNAKRRISSIALIHRQLYKEDQPATIDIAEYINDLIPFIIESLMPDKKDVNIEFDAQKFKLTVEDAVSIGLIINEVLTNSIRHGIKNQEKKEISIEVKKLNFNTIQIVAKDSGSGIQKVLSKKNSGFGYELIKMLASNYDGKVMVDDNENKITLELHFKMYDLTSVNI